MPENPFKTQCQTQSNPVFNPIPTKIQFVDRTGHLVWPWAHQNYVTCADFDWFRPQIQGRWTGPCNRFNILPRWYEWKRWKCRGYKGEAVGRQVRLQRAGYAVPMATGTPHSVNRYLHLPPCPPNLVHPIYTHSSFEPKFAHIIYLSRFRTVGCHDDHHSLCTIFTPINLQMNGKFWKSVISFQSWHFTSSVWVYYLMVVSVDRSRTKILLGSRYRNVCLKLVYVFTWITNKYWLFECLLRIQNRAELAWKL